MKRKKPFDLLLSLCTWLCAASTFAVLLFIIGYIMVKGIPHIHPSLFALKYTADNVSLMPALVTTVMTVLVSLLIAVPVGVFAAIYLVEYARRGSKLVQLVRLTSETLAGIPSIVYGLFGSIFFVVWLRWGLSLLSGSFTLSIMILPLVMRTTEESLKSVPDSYREGSFALGAGRLRTVFKIVLPTATPGILAGVILSVGRIVGETAAVIHTAGSMAQIPRNALSSGRTMAVHMYILASEGFNVGPAYATAVILLGIVLGLNALSAYATKKIVKR